MSKSVIVICNTTYLNYVGLPQSENKIIGICTYGLTFVGIALNYIANMLLPGYAAGVSSFAWGEIRVFPNLCVLGDAAGIAAAYCVNSGKYPLYLNSSDIASIQNTLASSAGARINK